MLYFIFFVVGIFAGFIIFNLTNRFVDYPGELVISKKDGMYLVIGDDFEEKTRFAMAITLKIHRI